MRQGTIWINNEQAGILKETDEGYRFKYHTDYLNHKNAAAIALSLPLQEKEFQSEYLFPFFDGLIPEGWLLEIAHKNWKLNPRDRMGLLLNTCHDCIGNISVREI
ncbi:MULTISPECIES: HipA N-terminal domain-containing protein [Winogradskyella]|uniref:HipA N-terminal domain-containing protein n=1 Tax=Winogradskyella TaxID=286104 RepID=UPI0015C7519D|nr:MULTISPECIES: HipA N-terminal domain-containing protein [Winogradskyella]QXP79808.1 HipA N-terminal domain-containing protein [Winogradskyella sp. HaHa_3_26]